MHKETLLISGATGFSGKYHIEKAINDGYSVIGVARDAERLRQLETEYPDFIGRSCDLAALDSEIYQVLQEHQPHLLIHLAAIVYQGEHNTPGLTLRNNGLSTLSVLEAARLYSNDTRVLITTSAAIYGGKTGRKDESSPVQSKDAYSASKIFDRVLKDAYSRQFGLDVVEAVVYNHNGPGRVTGIHPTIVKTMVKAKLTGQDTVDLKIPSLQYARDVQHVANWADASMTILQYGMTGEAYNVCSGEDLTLEAFIDELARQTGVSPSVITDPSITKFGPDIVSGGNNQKLRALNWEPKKQLPDLIRDMMSFWTDKLSREPAGLVMNSKEVIYDSSRKY